MIQITDQLLKNIYPNSIAKNRLKYLPYFNEYLKQYEISTINRLCAYFAQIGHESGQLYYSEEIASGSAYEMRKDLGNINDGDGIKFKGRGLIQITGRFNYQKLSNALGVDFIQEPELLSSPEFAVLSSLWFWKIKNLNQIADSGNFELLTRKINGGLNGIKDRLELFERCKRFIT